MYAEKPEHVAEQEQEQEGERTLGEVGKRDFQDSVDQAVQGLKGSQRTELSDDDEQYSHEDGGDDRGKAVRDLRRHAVRHPDNDVFYDEKIVDVRDCYAEDHGGEQACRPKVLCGYDAIHSHIARGDTHRDDEQEHEERDQTGQNGLTAAVKLIGHGLCYRKGGVEGDHVGSIICDQRDHGLEPCGCYEILVGIYIQS